LLHDRSPTISISRQPAGAGTVDSAIPGNLVIFCCSAGALLSGYQVREAFNLMKFIRTVLGLFLLCA
jgi:hypothetical protein